MSKGWSEVLILTSLVEAYAIFILLGTPAFGNGVPRQGSESQEKKVQELLVIVRDKTLRQTNPSRVVEAIQELGRLKAEAAVGELVGLLAFRRTWPSEYEGGPIQEIHTITPGDRYPAVGALMQIGMPCLPGVVAVIAKSGSDSTSGANALEIVRHVFREQPKAGVDYLKEAAGKASRGEDAQRLLKAAETLRQYKQ